MSNKVYLALGSNISPKEEYIFSALEIILYHPGIKNLEVSQFYNTSPVGGPVQENFINACCCFDTNLDPTQLLELTQTVERKLDKHILTPNGPRTIDLDILFYNNDVIQINNLSLPHPRWQQRLFVLKPLSDLTNQILLFPSPEKTLTINLKSLISNFSNPNNEKVSLLHSPFYRKIKLLISKQKKALCQH
ncbi:MAG: 2-amino-4-hydroxy-6-hydroxymethyldihydropteridine diphosphokinase [Chlamydiales bacterium]|nr:2-amino-4-hydroxy-6-hydroxymethyldihydropteridine diphosphokinase [Chlamydiales bacterium]